MKSLTLNETKLVSAATLYYVTEEWKHNEAVKSGACFSIVLGALGLLCGVSTPYPGAMGASLSLVGAWAGYQLGYITSQAENSDLMNNMWYDITYIHYPVYI